MYRLIVSQPSLTDFNKFNVLAKEVWESGILTHNGPKVQMLEQMLKKKWNIPYLSLVTNGTVALEIGLHALNLPKGSEIITTPFTWVATAASILWSNYKPIFADIDEETFNIDPNTIEDYITENTSAIMAVHVFSNPCEVEKIQKIADKHNLKVIYDGAHSVGVKYKGIDLSQYGDISTHSYHATKIFNTGEGGSIITKDNDLAEYIDRLKFFGHNKSKDIIHEGTNGKMHEISACIGLANLEMLDNTINYRKELTKHYMSILSEESDRIKFQKFNESSYNYSYFPVLFNTEHDCLNVYKSLEVNGILPRRYFYPSLDSIPLFSSTNTLSKSKDIAKRILCLPCHDNVTHDDVIEICDKILHVI